MSVIKAKRHTAKSEFEQTFSLFYADSRRLLSKVPKRRQRFICPKIVWLNNSIYNDLMIIQINLFAKQEERKIEKVDRGEMKLDDVYNSMQSWLAHAKLANSYHTVKSMLELYNDLFDGYKITKQYFRKQKRKGGHNNEILQSDKWADFRWNSNDFRASQNTIAT